MNRKIFGALTLLATSTILASCATNNLLQKKPQNDCSAIFEKNQKANPNQSTECKILPIKISKNINCEITGSDKVDNILKVFAENKNINRSMIIAPFKTLERSLSLKHRVYYYFAKQKVRSHIDSDLFTDLKDYEYKGFSCKIPAGTVTAWISDEKLIGSFEAK
jgi:hypothetical protein